MSIALDQESAHPAETAQPVVNISVITPKPEHFEEFMALQLAQMRATRGQVQGVVGSRLFKSLDNRSVVLIAAFESAQASQRFREDERLRAHLARVQPLIERAATGPYEMVYELGAI